jgi:hypothetical protein
MARLTDRQRERTPDEAFGLPKERKYPMPDEAHARNAKSRAAQQHERGNLTDKEKRTIDRKADRILTDD